MQIVDILVLATVALVLLGGLVALALGHRAWSIGTVVAGFLVLLSAAAFLALGARIAARDRAWKGEVATLEAQLAKAEHDRAAGPGAAGWQEGPDSLRRLRERRDRWRRGRDRIDTWRGRVWEGASFRPPKDDASPGIVALAPIEPRPAAAPDAAPDAKAADPPAPTSPIGKGALVFLFDAAPFEDGGAYLGEFRVTDTTFDAAEKRWVLSVVPTAPRDAYDARVLAEPHEAVTVFEDLPVDRWLAFYRSPGPEAAPDEGVRPEAVKEDADKVRGLLESSPEVKELVARFVETFRQHEADVPKDAWEDAVQEAAAEPGTLWAEVTFTKSHSFPNGAAAAPGPAETPGEPPADAAPSEEPGAEAAPESAPASEPVPGGAYAPGSRATFDLQTAIDLRDAAVATIDRVFRRRPLTDAMTLLHGHGAGDPAVGAIGGTPLLRQLLQDEIAALERSNERLRTARAAALANTEDERRVAGELEQDLASWRRDVEAAGALAAALERELAATGRRLSAAEEAIVRRGRDLAAAVDTLAREIDRVAPPPERRAARP